MSKVPCLLPAPIAALLLMTISVGASPMAAQERREREAREFVGKFQTAEVPDYELDLSLMRRAEDLAAELEEAVPGSFE